MEIYDNYIANELFHKKYPFYIYQLTKIKTYLECKKDDSVINNLEKSYFSLDFMDKIIHKINLLENNEKRINKAFHLSHLGLGDIIQMIGAIRYLSILYDELLVVVRTISYENVKSFFQDDDSIKFYVLDGDDADQKVNPRNANGKKCIEKLTQEYTNVYISGPCFGDHFNKWDGIGDCFYHDLKLDPKIRFDFFYIPIVEESLKLYELIKDLNFIFIQQKSSTGLRNLITWNKDEILTIDTNINVYKEDHKWHSLCNHFLNKPMNYYIKCIQEANELHFVNSSFSCLTSTIPSKALVKKCYDRNTGEIIKNFKFTDY